MSATRDQLTFKHAAKHICVYRGGRLTGHVLGSNLVGFFYQPKGSRLRGETFATLAECMRSLETEEAA